MELTSWVNDGACYGRSRRARAVGPATHRAVGPATQSKLSTTIIRMERMRLTIPHWERSVAHRASPATQKVSSFV